VLGVKRAIQCFGVIVYVRVGESGFHAGEFALQLRDARVACEHGFERGGVIQLWVLRQIAGGDAFGFGHRAAKFGCVLADDQFEQGGFARAVRADEADALVVLNLPGEVCENRPRPEHEGGV
jgi:hypothetical protein